MTNNDRGGRTWQQLQRWYREPLGRELSTAEAAILSEFLPFLFGYYAVVIGVSSGRDPLASSPIANRFRIDSQPPVGFPVNLLAETDQLPLQTDSIDLVVIPHTLEATARPDALIDELNRVLIPEGHAVIIGFNPRSLWGLWRLQRWFSRDSHWPRRAWSASRMQRTLAAAGLEVVNTRYCFYRPPLKKSRWLARLSFLERWGPRWWPRSGGEYIMLVKKRVTTLTRIKPRQRRNKRLVTVGIANIKQHSEG